MASISVGPTVRDLSRAPYYQRKCMSRRSSLRASQKRTQSKHEMNNFMLVRKFEVKISYLLTQNKYLLSVILII